MLKIYHSTTDYMRFAKILRLPEEFVGLGIKADSVAGDFTTYRLSDLVNFERENPEYQVHSVLHSFGMINRIEVPAMCYMLGSRKISGILLYTPTGDKFDDSYI